VSLGKHRHLSAAIEFRLEALARLSDRPEMKAWSIPDNIDGVMHIQGVVLRAAAAEPLREEDNRPSFDPESFFRRLIRMSKEAGRG